MALVVSSLIWTAAVAIAHEALVETFPGEQSTVSAPPASVRLNFNDEVLSLGARVVVVTPEGYRAEVDRARVRARMVDPVRAWSGGWDVDRGVAGDVRRWSSRVRAVHVQCRVEHPGRSGCRCPRGGGANR